MSRCSHIVEAIKFKLAREKRASLNSVADNALLALFGKNYIPTPEDGESMYSAMLKRDRKLDSLDLAGEAFANNPVLNSLGLKNNKNTRMLGSLAGEPLGESLTDITGGNPVKAVKDLHESLGPQTMGNFGRLGYASKQEANDAMQALVRNFHRNSPSEADGNAKTSAERVIGGKGDNKTDKEFKQDELKKGIVHEKEHTNNPAIAKEIAKDHLSERSDYYTALSRANIEK